MIYLDKDKKTYYIKFRYTDWTGKSKVTTRRGFSTKKEAKLYEQEYKLKAQGLPTMTVHSMVDELMVSLRKRLKPASIRQKEMLYRIYIIPQLGDMPIANITPKVIRHWQDGLPQDKSPATIKAINTVFSSLLNYAVKFHGLPSNPFIVAGKTGHQQKRTDFWEPAQFQTFINAVDSQMYHTIFNLFFYSGLRRGELLGLTIHDIDYQAQTITINKSMDDYGRVLPPKTLHSIRTITLPDFILQEIKDYRATLSDPPEQLFPTSYAMLKVAFNKYKKRVDLPYINLHGLRHSHASYLIQKGIPITTISRRLGHANSSVTLSVYSHFYKNSDADVAKMLENEKM